MNIGQPDSFRDERFREKIGMKRRKKKIQFQDKTIE
jgi:hypothetical protein